MILLNTLFVVCIMPMFFGTFFAAIAILRGDV